jgi:hypothetical protein
MVMEDGVEENHVKEAVGQSFNRAPHEHGNQAKASTVRIIFPPEHGNQNTTTSNPTHVGTISEAFLKMPIVQVAIHSKCAKHLWGNDIKQIQRI